MNGRIDVVHAFMIAYVNKVLDSGFKLPTPSNITDFVKQPRIRMFEKYLFIDAQPDFHSYDTHKHTLVRQIRQIESEMNGGTIYAEQKNEKNGGSITE